MRFDRCGSAGHGPTGDYLESGWFSGLEAGVGARTRDGIEMARTGGREPTRVELPGHGTAARRRGVSLHLERRGRQGTAFAELTDDAVGASGARAQWICAGCNSCGRRDRQADRQCGFAVAPDRGRSPTGALNRRSPRARWGEGTRPARGFAMPLDGNRIKRPSVCLKLVTTSNLTVVSSPTASRPVATLAADHAAIRLDLGPHQATSRPR